MAHSDFTKLSCEEYIKKKYKHFNDEYEKGNNLYTEMSNKKLVPNKTASFNSSGFALSETNQPIPTSSGFSLRMNQPIPIPMDDTTIEEGESMATQRECREEYEFLVDRYQTLSLFHFQYKDADRIYVTIIQYLHSYFSTVHSHPYSASLLLDSFKELYNPNEASREWLTENTITLWTLILRRASNSSEVAVMHHSLALSLHEDTHIECLEQLKCESHRLVIIPVNHGNYHWTLFTAVKGNGPNSVDLKFYDSINNDGRKKRYDDACNGMRVRYNALGITPNFTLITDIPEQKDGHNCGVFVIMNIRFLASQYGTNETTQLSKNSYSVDLAGKYRNIIAYELITAYDNPLIPVNLLIR